MKKDLTIWVQSELFPALWEVLPTIFKSRKLERGSSKLWHSPTYLDGTPCKDRKDKCWISLDTAWLIHEQGAGSKSLLDCYMEENNLPLWDAIRQLSNLAGLKPPKEEFDFNTWKRERAGQQLRADAQEYFVWNLHNSAMKEAKEVLKYLEEKRGYTEEKIKAMGLGFIPSQESLKKRLLSLGYEEKQIDEELHFNTLIGYTHKLSIHITTKGTIKGFTFRQTKEHPKGEVGKYMAESGIDRSSSFFYISPLKGDKDLVLVEGELDALASLAAGVEGVAAIGGNGSLTKQRMEDALKCGAEKITLCLDRDAGKEEQQDGLIRKGIDAALEAGFSKIYIASLPKLEEEPTKTDADSLIKYRGVEAFKKVIAEAQTWWEWEIVKTFEEFQAIEKEGGRGELTEKQTDALLDRFLASLEKIPGRVDRDRFCNTANKVLDALGIKRESFLEAADLIRSRKKSQAEEQLLSRTIAEATRLQQEGSIEEAEQKLKSGLALISEQTTTQDFAATLTPTTLQELEEIAANTPGKIGSGFFLSKNKEITFAGGALSIVAAPTSHGKTTFMLNVLLNLAEDERYRGKKWVVLSYEEPKLRMYQYLLNTYTNTALNDGEIGNRELIEEWWQTKQKPQYMSKAGFELIVRKKDEFFNKKRLNERILITEEKYNSEEVEGYVKYLAKRGDIGGLFVDYFQYLKLPSSSAKRNISRQEEFKEICQNLNDAAKESGLPIVLLAQFNRKVVSADLMHPTNIREAADIEHIAHTLLGLWDCSQKSLKSTEKGSNRAGHPTESRDSGLYVEVLKSRYMRVGAWAIFEYNGNTNKIEGNAPQRLKLTEEEVFKGFDLAGGEEEEEEYSGNE